MLNPAEPTHIRLLARVAWMYYIEGLTQKEIGDLLQLSRVKVNRLLQQARESGLVEIKINTPQSIYVDLEVGLCQRYGLRDALVVHEAEPGEALYRSLAQGAATWLHAVLQPEMVVGIGQSRTLSYIPQFFPPGEALGCRFVEIIGGAGNHASGFANYNITSRMAELTGSKACYLYAPTIVSSPEVRDTFVQEPAIANVLQLAREAQVILHSVGPVDHSALLYMHGYLNDQDLAELRALGAVADSLGQFFDATGQIVDHRVCKRSVSISLDDLKRIPYSVLVGGGAEKIEPLRAAMLGRIVNVLITDSVTARELSKGAAAHAH